MNQINSNLVFEYCSIYYCWSNFSGGVIYINGNNINCVISKICSNSISCNENGIFCYIDNKNISILNSAISNSNYQGNFPIYLLNSFILINTLNVSSFSTKNGSSIYIGYCNDNSKGYFLTIINNFCLEDRCFFTFYCDFQLNNSNIINNTKNGKLLPIIGIGGSGHLIFFQCIFINNSNLYLFGCTGDGISIKLSILNCWMDHISIRPYLSTKVFIITPNSITNTFLLSHFYTKNCNNYYFFSLNYHKKNKFSYLSLPFFLLF